MVMPHRQSYKKQTLPKVWLMTDPRLGDGLLAAVRKLPMRSGVVFRHYDLPEGERRALFRRIARICRQRGHILVLAGLHDWNAKGVHGKPRVRPHQILTMPVHSVNEIRQAKALGADLMFLSPLFATRSHPGARVLGLIQFSRLAKLTGGAKVIALGGITRNKAQALTRRVAYGWAAIDAFAR
jgi:thiamine-phosphate pyrophosphorylase